jgi:hypothetical protein
LRVVLDGGKELSLKPDNLEAVTGPAPEPAGSGTAAGVSQLQEGVKACSVCGQERGPESYSKNQWGARAHSRKCKQCVDASTAGVAEDAHGSTPAQLTEQLKGLDVRSKSPCVPEADDRLVYELMQCLGGLALPLINEERAQLCMAPLVFDGRDAQRNELRTRTLVYRYVMAHIDDLARRFCTDNATSADAKHVKRTLGRRPTASISRKSSV